MAIVHHGKMQSAVIFIQAIIKDSFVLAVSFPHPPSDKVAPDGQSDVPSLYLHDYLCGERLIRQRLSPVNPDRVDGKMVAPGK